jgi:hypothetical protein
VKHKDTIYFRADREAVREGVFTDKKWVNVESKEEALSLFLALLKSEHSAYLLYRTNQGFPR